jgi:hypothetical protein
MQDNVIVPLWFSMPGSSAVQYFIDYTEKQAETDKSRTSSLLETSYDLLIFDHLTKPIIRYKVKLA